VSGGLSFILHGAFSFFLILLQIKGRNGNTKIKEFKIASGDTIRRNYFTTLKNCFEVHTLIA
jgi:hypothetical protein